MAFQLLQCSTAVEPAAFTPDSATFSISDNLDVRVRVIMDDWTATNQTFVAKRQGGNEWTFRTNGSTGRLEFVWWDSGAVATTETASADHGFVDGSTHWIRVRRAGTSVFFYTSDDDTNDHTAVSWSQLGATQTTPAGGIRTDICTFVTIGAAGTGGGASLFGYIYAVAIVNNTTDAANPIFADPTEWTVGDGKPDTGVDAAGITWTLGLNGLIVGDNVQGAFCGLQAAFGEHPTSGAPNWTDITDDMRAVSFQRGRQYELDRINAGTMTVTLSNASGDYNAHNTLGAYYPDIKPMVPIRLRAVYDGQIYPLWQGFVERWPVSFPAQVDSVVEVQCVDLFKALSLADAVQEDRTTAVNALSPVAWYRFADEADEVGSNDMIFSGTPVEGTAAGAWEADVATTFDGTNDSATFTTESAIARFNSDRSYEFWFSINSAGSGTDHLFFVQGDGVYLQLNYNHTTDQLNLPFHTIDGTTLSSGFNHVVLSHDHTANTETAYVNGVLVGGPTAGLSTESGTPDVHVGSAAGADFFMGVISEFVVYPTALTGQQVATLYSAQVEAYETERTDERIAYILSDSAIGIGAEFVFTDLEEGQTTMSGPNSPTDVSALEAIQTAADTELGQFFMTGNGYARFHDRHYRLMNQETPIDTFGPSNLAYSNVILSMDDERIYNDIRVAPSDVADPFIAQDEDSIEAYGRRTLALTTYPDDQNEAYDFAHALKQTHAEPTTRIEAVDFRLGHDVDLWPVILNAELGNRYTVDVPLAGDDLNQDVYLEALAHTITKDKVWDVTFQLSPAADDTFWLIGVTGSSEVGETTIYGF